VTIFSNCDQFSPLIFGCCSCWHTMDIVLEAIEERESWADHADDVRRCQENCNNMRFSDICVQLEQMEKTSGTDAKCKIMFDNRLKRALAGQSLYPLLRLILPDKDFERGNYNMKEAMVSMIYVDALQLNRQKSSDAQMLLSWRVCEPCC
jgi:hypothetical protein